MRRRTLKNRLFSIAAVVLPLLSYAQNPSDCSGAIVICEDTDVDVPDSAGDVLDFNNPDNELGCHITGESSAVWLYFSFRDDMPPGSELRFLITPFEEYNNGEEPDYDFSLFSADLNCDSLGDPLRCSYAWAISNSTYDCGFCPSTGLGNGETDTSEGPFGNGFVAPVIVEPGQGFYLYLNEFPNNSGGSSISDGFNISFSGSAAPYLDCGANPNCDLQVVSLGADTTLCSGDIPFPLSADVSYSTGYESYTWTGFNGEESFLDDPNSPNPLLTFPDGYSGSVTFELEVAAGNCVNYDTIVFEVEPTPVIMVDREVAFCEGDSVALDAGPGFSSYLWSDATTQSSITVDQAGTYSVTVSSTGNSCTISRDVEVTEAPIPMPSVGADTFLCAGEIDTLITLQPYASYQWTGGTTDAFLVVDQAGTYGLSVTSDAGCAGDVEINIQDAPVQSLVIQGPAGICPNTGDTLSAGSWMDYQWSDGGVDSLLEVNTAGTYSLTVTDEFGCVYENSIDIGLLQSPQPQILGDSILCNGGTSALVTAQAYPAFEWSTGETGASTPVTGAGLYEVTVTSSQGCIGQDSFRVEELPPLAVDISVDGGEPLCEGDSVTISVEQSYASYAWEQGGTTATVVVAEGGVYRVTVTDDLGCTAADSIVVMQNPAPPVSINGPSGLCPGASGQLEVSTFETIRWDDGTTENTLDINEAGIYSVTVSDALGCEAADTVDVRALQPPSPAIVGDTSLCEGGQLSFSLSEDYAVYDWGGMSDMAVLTVDQAGTYTVTVVNIEGCVGSDTVTVAAFPNPSLDLPMADAFCTGDSLLLSAPQSYDAYAWSTGDADSTITVTAEGEYRLTVTNEFGCTATDSLSVTENLLPESGLSGPYPFCDGDSVTLSGDPAAGDYEWFNGTAEPTIVIDEGGSYSLTITDDNNCQSISNIELIEQALPEPAIIGGPNLCVDSSLVLAADSTYVSYNWTGGGTDSTVIINSPGTYLLTVTDALGCVGSTNIDIQEVPLPQIGFNGPLSFCEGGTLFIGAGPGFQDYQWSNGSQDPGIVVMDEGLFSVTVTDINGCVNSDSVQTIELPEPSIDILGDTLFCNGGSTDLSLPGSYNTILWSTGSNEATETFTEEGAYSVAVVDLNNCSNDTLFNIEELPPIDATIVGEPIVCEGESAVLQVEGDVVAFDWSTGVSDTSAITVSETGVYRVTITDSFGCQEERLFGFQVSETPSLMLPDSLYFCEDSTVTAEAISPEAVLYEWSNGSSEEQIVVNNPGWYELTVTNSFGCTAVDSVVVAEVELPVPIVDGELSLCPGESTVLQVVNSFPQYDWSTGANTSTLTVDNPGAYQLTVTNNFGCSASTNVIVDEVPATDVSIVDIDVFCTGDTMQLVANSSNANEYEWSDGTNGDTLTLTSGGVYTVTVTNVFGCTAEDQVTVEAFEQPQPAVPDYLSDCAGETLSFTAAPGFESYLWNTGAAVPQIAASQSGLYIVTVTDVNGCIGVDTTEVFLKPPPNPQLTPAQNICQGSSATLEVSGDWSVINWTNGETTPSITVSEAGSYGVIVEDSLGCVGAYVTVVQVFSVPPPPIAGEANICPGASTVLAVPDGYAVYEWSNGADSTTIEVSEAGIYEVTVTDTVGCFNSSSLAVSILELPTAEITGDPFLCEGEVNLLTVNTDADSILWSTGATAPSITVNQAGSYAVSVLSADNCLVVDSLLVEATDAPQPVFGDIPAIDCNHPEVSLGGVIVGSGYLYEWSGPGILAGNENEPEPVVSEAGVYSVQVQDSLTGCLADLTVFELLDLTYTPAAEIALEDTLDCNTPSVSLDGGASESGGAIIYQWLDNEGMPISNANGAIYQAEQAGSYSLLVTDTLTGCANSTSITVFDSYEAPTAVVNPNVDELNCINTTSTIMAVGHAAIDTFSVNWAFGDSQNILDGELETQLEVSAPGWYFFIVTDATNGCQAIDSVLVTQDITPPEASLTALGELDCQNNAVTLSANGSSEGASFSYNWSGPNGFTANTFGTQVVQSPGVYSLTVTNNRNGCASMATTTVISLDNTPTLLNTIETPPGCLGEENGLIQIVSVEGGTPPFMYSFDGGPFSAQTAYTGLPSGSYTITVQDAFGCELITTINLESGQDVQLELGEDQTIDFGESVQIIAQTNLDSGQIASISWAPADSAACSSCLAWVDQPAETTIYTATITDTLGCTATDQMRVVVVRDRSVFIPNSFSPNGDGNNDRFTVFSGPEVRQIRTLQIYDRWGNQVFAKENFPPSEPAFGWDGRFRNRAMDIGLFVYFAEVEFTDGWVQLYEGGVHLVK